MSFLAKSLAQGFRRPIIASQFQRVFLFSSDASQPASKEAIEALVKKNKVVVFMKGVPDQPKCGFSNAVVQILRMHGVSSYDAHDVLENESIRQGMYNDAILLSPCNYDNN